MGKIIYVSGGARSGKSSFSEKYIAERYEKKIYLATGIPFDSEMKDRIEKHKKQRGKNWKTIEKYKNIPKILGDHIEGYNVVLLDCLTNMVSNHMILEEEIDWEKIDISQVNKKRKFIINEIKEIIKFIKESPVDMVVVSNEVGMGIVPDYPLGRHFRDISGKINQIVAEEAKEAYFIVSGLPLKLK